MFDDPFLKVTQFLYPDLYIVAERVIDYGFGIMFPNHTDDAIVENFSLAILKINERFPFEQRLQEFIDEHYKKPYLVKPPLKPSAYGFWDFYMMWEIYAFGLAAGIGILILIKMKEYQKSLTHKRSTKRRRMSIINPQAAFKRTATIRNMKRKLIEVSPLGINESINGKLRAMRELSKEIYQELEQKAFAPVSRFNANKELSFGVKHRVEQNALLIANSRYYNSTSNFYGQRGKFDRAITKAVKKQLEGKIAQFLETVKNKKKELQFEISGVLLDLANSVNVNISHKMRSEEEIKFKKALRAAATRLDIKGGTFTG
jgi:hypothetical protein